MSTRWRNGCHCLPIPLSAGPSLAYSSNWPGPGRSSTLASTKIANGKLMPSSSERVPSSTHRCSPGRFICRAGWH